MATDGHSKQPPTIPSLLTHTTPRPPCCLTVLSEEPAIFAVGMYELVNDASESNAAASEASSDQKSQKRVGCIDIMRVVGSAEAPELQQLAHIDTNFGILDLVQCPEDAAPFLYGKDSGAAHTLAAATSVGAIAILKVSSDYASWTTRLMRVAASDDVITQVGWHPTTRAIIGFTTSSGKVQVMSLPATSKKDGVGGDDNAPWLEIMNNCQESLEIQMQSGVLTPFEHSLEAWVLAFPDARKFIGADDPAAAIGALDGQGLWSGSDDATLAFSHLHDNQQHGGLPMPQAWSDKKVHGAGVTTILPVFLKKTRNTILVTGSYDDHLRVLSVADTYAPMKRPKVLAEANLGGGVWCFKTLSFVTPASRPDNSYSIRLLVCCMYAGARVVEMTGTDAESDWTIKVLAQFTEHESMCYGGDSWVLSGVDGDGTSASRMMATCSFYDRRVCLWRLADV